MSPLLNHETHTLLHAQTHLLVYNSSGVPIFRYRDNARLRSTHLFESRRKILLHTKQFFLNHSSLHIRIVTATLQAGHFSGSIFQLGFLIFNYRSRVSNLLLAHLQRQIQGVRFRLART